MHQKSEIRNTTGFIIFLLLFSTLIVSCEYPDYFLPPQDDEFEENDSQEQAFDLSHYENQYLSVVKKEAIHLDADWYQFTIASVQTIQITCLFTFDYDNDLDLKLYRNNSLIASSVENTSDEVLVVNSIEAGTYYIYVFNGLNGDKGQGTKYDLKWEIL